MTEDEINDNLRKLKALDRFAFKFNISVHKEFIHHLEVSYISAHQNIKDDDPVIDFLESLKSFFSEVA